ncbi:hypothetical protein ACS0TY_005316 [Phlomoides rotata]
MKRLPNLEHTYGFLNNATKEFCITFMNNLLVELNLRKILGELLFLNFYICRIIIFNKCVGWDANGHFVVSHNPVDLNLPHLNVLYPELPGDKVNFVNEFLAEISYRKTISLYVNSNSLLFNLFICFYCSFR